MNKRIVDLEKFVRKFLDNFETCEACDGTGWIGRAEDNCHKCRGTGEQIASVGVLFVDLPNDARELLGEE